MAGEEIEFINSQRYSERLGEDFGLFRQAVAYKRGTLGSQGGSGYAPPGVRALAARIAPPTASYSHGGKAEGRPLWSVADVEAFEARESVAVAPEGRVRRPSTLMEVDDRDVERVLGGLPAREADVLRRRLGLGGDRPRTLADIGLEMEVSRERVRQIERSAVAKVREALALAPWRPSGDRRRSRGTSEAESPTQAAMQSGTEGGRVESGESAVSSEPDPMLRG